MKPQQARYKHCVWSHGSDWAGQLQYQTQCLSLFDPIKYLSDQLTLKTHQCEETWTAKFEKYVKIKFSVMQVMVWQEAGGCDWFSWRHFNPHATVTLVRPRSHRVKSPNSQLTQQSVWSNEAMTGETSEMIMTLSIQQQPAFNVMLFNFTTPKL